MSIDKFMNNIKDMINKELLIICVDDQKITGKLFNYVSELDNEPDGAAIDIWLTQKPGFEDIPMEIELSEIKSIEII